MLLAHSIPLKTKAWWTQRVGKSWMKCYWQLVQCGTSERLNSLQSSHPCMGGFVNIMQRRCAVQWLPPVDKVQALGIHHNTYLPIWLVEEGCLGTGLIEGLTSSNSWLASSNWLTDFPFLLGTGNGLWLLFPLSQSLDSPAVVARHKARSLSPASLLQK